MSKKEQTKIKRWWNYQLISVLDENEEKCCALYEVSWVQEGKNVPRIWLYQEPVFACGKPEEVRELLLEIAEDIKTRKVLTEKDLPTDAESEKEYEKLLEETGECDKKEACGGSCCDAEKE